MTPPPTSVALPSSLSTANHGCGRKRHTVSTPPATVRTVSENIRRMIGYSIHPPFVGMVNGMHAKRIHETGLLVANFRPQSQVRTQLASGSPAVFSEQCGWRECGRTPGEGERFSVMHQTVDHGLRPRHHRRTLPNVRTANWRSRARTGCCQLRSLRKIGERSA
jgi:hypothetical protein